jgi:hypothetical protein
MEVNYYYVEILTNAFKNTFFNRFETQTQNNNDLIAIKRE